MYMHASINIYIMLIKHKINVIIYELDLIISCSLLIGIIFAVYMFPDEKSQNCYAHDSNIPNNSKYLKLKIKRKDKFYTCIYKNEKYSFEQDAIIIP